MTCMLKMPVASQRHRGLRWSENRALPSGIRWERASAFRRKLGDVQLRRAEEAAEVEARDDFDRRHPGVLHPTEGVWWSLAGLQGLSLERGPPPVVARGEGDWCVLETVGEVSRGQVWTNTDCFSDVRGAAAIGTGSDYPGELVMVLRWVGPAGPPPLSLNDSRVLPLAFLPLGADRARRKIRVQEVFELLTETNAEDWRVAGPRTLAWSGGRELHMIGIGSGVPF